jgi:mannobiose 2-epimerase
MACESIEDSVRLEQAQQQLVRLVDYSIAHCKHPSGSYLFGLDKSGTDAKTMYWWTQTEASNALVAAAKITHDYRYYDELISLWESIQAHWIDHKQGEWFSELNTNLKPAGCTNKVDFWRCNYHTTRACFYVARANYYKKYITQPTHNPAPLIA